MCANGKQKNVDYDASTTTAVVVTRCTAIARYSNVFIVLGTRVGGYFVIHDASIAAVVFIVTTAVGSRTTHTRKRRNTMQRVLLQSHSTQRLRCTHCSFWEFLALRRDTEVRGWK